MPSTDAASSLATVQACGYCGISGSGLLRCSRCRAAFYCDKHHQRKHWKQHKVSCGSNAKVTAGDVPKHVKAADFGLASAPADTSTKSVVTAESPSDEPTPSSTPSVSASEFATAATDDVPRPQKPKPVVNTENGEDVQDFLDAEVRLSEELEVAKATWGPEEPRTVAVYFQLFDVLIAMYRLERLDKLLDEILPVCEKSNAVDFAKAIQMQAFLRYKQFRFKESLANFLKFQSIMGSSAELSENVGHTYNAMGNYAMAESSFQDALRLMEEHKGNIANKGGVLLGLGTVRQKQKKHEDALPILNQALTFYLQRFKGQDHSLIAKARMGVASALQSLERYDEALGHIKEAVRLFIKTCSYESPLTANAMCRLATVLLLQKNYQQAQPFLYSALKLHVSYDTLNLPTILTLVQQILDVHAKGGGDPLRKDQYQPYIPLIEEARRNIIAQGLKEKDDGTIAVLYKTSSEMCLLAGAFQTAQPMILDALGFLRTVRDLDVSNLIEICESMLVYVVKRIGEGDDSGMSSLRSIEAAKSTDSNGASGDKHH
eukprot:gb/GEZN01005054.1/.p1 GENE.gb/GEZN01005054.1/~~gb/GEZN01005054.1/.p1  ORF type:complete len:546 (-),score=84.45 gb/GEZN01005054.1/:34-1671(-)